MTSSSSRARKRTRNERHNRYAGGRSSERLNEIHHAGFFLSDLTNQFPHHGIRKGPKSHGGQRRQ